MQRYVHVSEPVAEESVCKPQVIAASSFSPAALRPQHPAPVLFCYQCAHGLTPSYPDMCSLTVTSGEEEKKMTRVFCSSDCRSDFSVGTWFVQLHLVFTRSYQAGRCSQCSRYLPPLGVSLQVKSGSEEPSSGYPSRLPLAKFRREQLRSLCLEIAPCSFCGVHFFSVRLDYFLATVSSR